MEGGHCYVYFLFRDNLEIGNRFHEIYPSKSYQIANPDIALLPLTSLFNWLGPTPTPRLVFCLPYGFLCAQTRSPLVDWPRPFVGDFGG